MVMMTVRVIVEMRAPSTRRRGTTRFDEPDDDARVVEKVNGVFFVRSEARRRDVDVKCYEYRYDAISRCASAIEGGGD